MTRYSHVMEEPTSEIGSVRETYVADPNAPLTDAILDAIQDSMGQDLERSHFALFDDIDHEALNDLFHRNSTPRTTVTISGDGVAVELWRDDETYISVVESPDESEGRRADPE
ncbi:hypothetical protein HUG10_17215 [Halorarum halophilum]|uniref:Halobacterial output domain-containing protein n=1 Tax=Halorarum halophilum TaxID=2743090 RepID=A0A7D5L2Z2_9EURY|nr:HalOD1 output domain-containing protein [Halobaculum halophilum]QLG29163.1 hypothetical protein HUG10_17215 [Halobaculum halophilum]